MVSGYKRLQEKLALLRCAHVLIFVLNMKEPDFKYIASAEGVGLVESYDWFKDPKVIESFVNACSELIEDGLIATEKDRPLNVLGIGSGMGNVEREAAEALRKNGLRTNLFITDLPSLYEDEVEGKNDMPKRVAEYNRKNKIQKPWGGSFMFAQENKEMKVRNDFMDLVLARSVTHYESTPEMERKVLSEVLRVLKPGGFFIDQAPTLYSRAEADLISRIHQMLPKVMNIQTGDETKSMLNEFFDVREAVEDHQSTPLLTSKKMFLMRYGINDQAKIRKLTEKIIESILSVQQAERLNVWCDESSGDFGWSVPFTIYRCQKTIKLYA